MSSDITRILQRVSRGDEEAIRDLTPLVYQQLRQIAQKQLTADNDARRWDATELVHEAYLRMLGDTAVGWRDRVHFFATAAVAIRHVLVDHARQRNRLKRGGGAKQADIAMEGLGQEDRTVSLLDLDDALQHLAALSPRQAKLVELRFFGGLTHHEAADLLGVSVRTAAGDWAMARAWLRRELAPPD